MNQGILVTDKALTPRTIVEELDRYIIGQRKAKRAVAVALRNRWRRKQVPEDLRDEIAPKNIIMIGPTGVGKTEIARRLAKLAQAPFLKVEASKYTEVGYVGRDVESMIRDVTEIGVNMVKELEQESVMPRAREAAEERLLDLLLPPPPKNRSFTDRPTDRPNGATTEEPAQETTRDKLRKLLRAGKLDERKVEVETADNQNPIVEIFTGSGVEEMGFNVKDMFGQMGKRKQRKVPVPEALEILTGEEAQKLVDMDKVVKAALELVQESGIIFLDELDKITGREGGRGPDVSREGVQRDLLPIIEGSTVTTKYGPVRTDHILFIAAGAFHVAKPSDMVPELQGRFPIRVELDSLGSGDFVRILTEPDNALSKQYSALMATEQITLEFDEGSIQAIADIAARVNERNENIGARRLHTVMETLLEELSFEAPELGKRTIPITAEYVNEKLGQVVEDQDLSRYIL